MKNLLLLLSFLTLLSVSQAQDVTYTMSASSGSNPHLLNTTADAYFTGWTTALSASAKVNNWSKAIALPSSFKFHFYGENVTHFKVSCNGLVTFDTTNTGVVIPGENTSLPSAYFPKMSIACFWDAFPSLGGTNADDFVYYTTIGSSPHRQLWIKWYSMKMGVEANNYFACVLEEGTSNIYMVDLYNGITTAGVSSKLSSTIGIQKYSAEGMTYSSSATLQSTSTAYANNYFYTFSPSYDTLTTDNYTANYYRKKGNPLGVNTTADDYKTGWTTLLGASSANKWSAATALPFSFKFFDEEVSSFMVSLNGVLTFTTTATALPDDNSSLPSASLPDKSIACFWDKAATKTSSNDMVYYYVSGKAPNRQLWIKWYSMKYGSTATENNFFACVLEETSNRIYMVDLYNGSGAITNTSSVGLQYNSSVAIDYGSSLYLKSESTGLWNNNYFMFSPVYESPLLSYTQPNKAYQLSSWLPYNTASTIYDSSVPTSDGWTAISGYSTLASITSWSSAITMPFNFLFFGEAVSSFKVTPNGLLTFSSSTNLLPSVNENLPSSSLPDKTIACYWDDYPTTNLGSNDVVYYKVTGSEPNRLLWVRWYSMCTGNPYVSDNFYGCMLQESNNYIYIIDMYYNKTKYTNNSMTMGVQYNGSYAIQYGDDYTRLQSPSVQLSDNYFYMFVPEKGDTQVVYTQAELEAGETKPLCSPYDDDCTDKTVNSAYLNLELSTGEGYQFGSKNEFKEEVTFTLTPYTLTSTGSESSNITLSINQNQPKQLYREEITSSYEDLIGYKIKITSYDSLNNLVHDSLQLKAYYTSDLGVDVTDVSLSTQAITSPCSSNPVTLSWQAKNCGDDVPGYEVQIMRLYNTSSTYEDIEEAVSTTINWDHALSILTESSNTSLSLTLTEGTGYYIWRVRPIGTYYENGYGNSQNWGNWSDAYDESDGTKTYSKTTDLSSTEKKFMFYYQQFDTDKNWIYNRTFTEQNKIAEGISYGTGLGQLVQTQRKLQEIDSVLMSQTVYDYVGRPAIQSMVAPVNQDSLGYHKMLIQDTSGNAYNVQDFDVNSRTKFADDLDSVPIWENPLPMVGPINNYFSDLNSDINIPAADSFAFSRTLYHQDGRVKKQSLFGAEHRMGLYDQTYIDGGMQRTVRTYYSAVSDTALLKVFGNQAPADSSVYKIVRVDPNEMPTVEYKTLDGKTIATCLISTGDHPLLDDISTNTIYETKQIKSTVQLNDYTLLKEASIYFADPTVTPTYAYYFNVKDFKANCVDYCSTCDYTLNIYGIREETNELKFDTTIIIGPSSCDEDYTDTIVVTDDISCSDPGNYRFGCRISVNTYNSDSMRYADYHGMQIDSLMDIQNSKFDTLFTYLEEEDLVLDELYTFIDDLPTEQYTTTMVVGSDVSVGSSSSTNILNPLGTSGGGNGVINNIGGGNIGGGPSYTSVQYVETENDLWVSSTDTIDDIPYYNIASSCCTVAVPKIDCGFDLCSEWWIDYDLSDGTSIDEINSGASKEYSNGSETYKDIIEANKGYYDFESVLTDKAIDEGWTDSYDIALEDKLYRYFKDKYGDYTYPSGDYHTEAKIYIDAGQYDFDDHPNYLGSTLTMSITQNGTEVVSYVNTLEDEADTTSSETERDIAQDYLIYDPDYNFNGDEHPYNNDEDKNTATTEGDFLHRSCAYSSGSSDCDKYFTGYELAKSMWAYLNQTYPNYEFSVSSLENDKYTITIKMNFVDHPELEATTFGLNFTSTNTNIADHISFDDFELHNPSTTFQYGNGAFNAMANHMIQEDGYDCYTIMTIWEGLANNYNDMKDTYGYDLLDEFLKAAGKMYTGYAYEPYDTSFTDADAYSGFPGSDGQNDPSHETRTHYGYLEYAYKSFYEPDFIKMDEYPNESYTDQELVLNNQQENCLSMMGISNFKDAMSKWTNPTETDENGNPEWDTESCGTYAWWDPSTGKVIGDEKDEDGACKVWEQLYTCLNSDLENIVEEEDEAGTFSSCSNTPSLTCTQEITGAMVDSAQKICEYRGPTISTRLQKLDATIYPNSVLSDYVADEIVSKLKNQISITIQDDDANNIPESIATDNEMASIYKIMMMPLEVSTEEPANFTGKVNVEKLFAKTTVSYADMQAYVVNKMIQKAGNAPVKASEMLSELEETDAKFKLGSFVKSGLGSYFKPDSLIKKAGSNGSVKVTVKDGKLILATTSGIGASATTTYRELYKSPINPSYSLGPVTGEWKSTFSWLNLNTSHILSPATECDPRLVEYVRNAISEQLLDCKNYERDTTVAIYKAACTLPTNITDSFTIKYSVDYHQYTLFFYDVAGNLVQTVPPKGADVMDMDTNDDGIIDQRPTLQDEKNHTLTTDYSYNSLGQRIYEKTPDGGVKQFWYNSIGQLRFSQNEVQKADNDYAYIKYDDLGRIIEAGRCANADADFEDNVDDQDYPSSSCKEQIYTVFTEAYSETTLSDEQRYIQNRVSYAYTGDEIYTIYSYDPHGNVEWLIQRIPGMDDKKIAYEYDLITSKVKKVKYNEGYEDQFFHRYSYDSDNRIKTVETSRDGVIWDKDATYEYYAYGPLKRVSIGEDNIQGLDHVYTLNGWLKAINHQSLSSTYDPGKDGNTAYGNFPTDAFGMTLGYFNGDFKRGIDNNKDGTLDQFSVFNSEFYDNASPYYNTGIQQMSWDMPDATGSTTGASYTQLFNGTITNMAYNTASTTSSTSNSYDGKVKGFMYKYDELYRLVQSNFDYYNGSSWVNGNDADGKGDYFSSYEYDKNGNITSLNRNGYYTSSNKLGMDALSYVYNNETNQLNSVNDLISSGNYGTDLDDQKTDNYTYNANGQLTADVASGVSKIEWGLNGKVSKVTKSDGTTLNYTYDALGNKISKTETGKLGVSSTTSYYVRDANGSEMAIYKGEYTTSGTGILSGSSSGTGLGSGTAPSLGSGSTTTTTSLTLKELPIYAAGGRLGTVKDEVNVTSISKTSETGTFTRSTGFKFYELKDHLGNMRAVVSDEKNAAINATTGAPENFTADVVSLADYYPFGMEMPGQTVSSSDYRYGYQGKEKETELMGNAVAYDFGARILDARVGRWLSLDPLAEKFAGESPYSAMANDPINMVDPDGMAPEPARIISAEQRVLGVSGGILGRGEFGFGHASYLARVPNANGNGYRYYLIATVYVGGSAGLEAGGTLTASTGVAICYSQVESKDNSPVTIDEVVDAIGGWDKEVEIGGEGSAEIGGKVSVEGSSPLFENTETKSDGMCVAGEVEAGVSGGVYVSAGVEFEHVLGYKEVTPTEVELKELEKIDNQQSGPQMSDEERLHIEKRDRLQPVDKSLPKQAPTRLAR